MKTVKIALLGLGNVGRGVWNILKMNEEEIMKRSGYKVEVAKILVRDKNKPRTVEVLDEIVTTDFNEILNDDSIKIVVEVMGGIEPAKDYILKAMSKKKNVVTANKMLIATNGDELFHKADEEGVMINYEASVAGGIPIIQSINESLTANKIEQLYGIVNGTTNFILTKMTHEGMEFDEALALATELGYAEADPTADIEGYDAGRKMAIMASIAFNSRVTFDDVYTEGITNITAKDIKYAEAMGCTIKLLGVAKNTESGIEVRVHPMLIPSDHPLATVNDSFNAVFVHGDAVDDAMFYGRGAGEFPTASAVMGDIIDVARNIQFYCTGRIHCTCYKDLPIKKITEIESKYFMRLLVDDKPGVLARIADTLGKNQVSIAQVIQKNKVNDMAELVVITDLVLEQNFADALVEIKGMEHTREISTVIRVY